MRSILGLLSLAVLAASASTSSAATLTLTDTVGDPASVSVIPGASFSFNAALALGAGENASGIGFNLHASQNSVFTITARSLNASNPFTDLTATDAQVLANGPGLNPLNGTDLGGITPSATNVLPATYPLYTFTLSTNAAAPRGTYQITVVEAYYTNEAFDSIEVASGTYNVTLVPEPISLGTMGVVLGGLVLRPKRRVVEQ